MRRRGGGLGALKAKEAKAKAAAEVGTGLADDHMKHMADQLKVFKENLEEFAHKYKHQINKDPEFRRHFQKMTAQIGVDPLASSKGFWAEVLGVSDFYYELAVQIVDVCLATRPINGGLLDLAELQVRLERMRGSRAQAIGEDDIVRAVGKLKLLGGGYDLRNVGARKMIVSVPYELNPDHATVLQLASSSGGFVTDGSLAEAARWPEPRRVRVLQSLLKEGMAWVDDQAPAPADARLTPAQRRRYYFPAAMGGGARGGEASPVAGGAGGAGS